MCGIYGMVSLTEHPLRHPQLLDCMGATLRHRGPDDSGALRSAHAAVGAERLRIIDSRSQANQPFRNPSNSVWLVCNGEIYNAAALREQFASYPFRSRCDVETLVPLFDARGVSGFADVEGMFAIAIWKEETRSLTLARDRAGEKPLFYLDIGGEIWFASEIQALLRHPDVSRELSDAALYEYLALGYVREPNTLFRQVRKVPGGSSLTFHAGRAVSTQRIAVPTVAVPPSAPAARRLLRELLEDAVAKQMTADVPVGVFTSGGVDSSLIAALASRIAPYRVHTFTASFTNRKYDEGVYARRLSRNVGTEHIEIKIGEDELMDALHTVVPRMAEPLADPALLPTYLLARTAKDYVGVVLTGEGADELFGGYPTYLGHRAARAYASLPHAVRGAIETLTSKVAATDSPVPLSLMMNRFTTYAHADWLERHIGWFGTGLLPYLPREAQESFRESLPEITARDPVRAAMEFDYITYLRDGLLVKLDRAGMLVSLESRAPFLDSRVVAFARGLPPDFIIRGLRTKRLLKEAAATLVPGWALRRRKRGLSVPIAAWINNGLRSEVDRLLDPARLRNQGVLPALPIDELLSDHRAGRANHARALWPLVVLQYWLEHWVPGGET